MSKDRLLHRPSTFMLVLQSDDHVDVYHGGFTEWDEFFEAVHAAQDYASAKRYGRDVDLTAERTRRRDDKARSKAEAAQYLVDHPHQCPGCKWRFKTERGLAQHRTLSKRHAWLKECHPGG